MSSAPLTRLDIESALLDVADELGADGEGQAEIIVVGGSFMALHDLRDSTADVDSVSPLATASALRSAALPTNGAGHRIG